MTGAGTGQRIGCRNQAGLRSDQARPSSTLTIRRGTSVYWGLIMQEGTGFCRRQEMALALRTLTV